MRSCPARCVAVRASYSQLRATDALSASLPAPHGPPKAPPHAAGAHPNGRRVPWDVPWGRREPRERLRAAARHARRYAGVWIRLSSLASFVSAPRWMCDEPQRAST